MKKIATSVLVLTMALFLAAPAMAEFEAYGSARLLTGWYNYDPNIDGVHDDNYLVWGLSDISRFGAKFKTGDLGGRVEFGFRGEGNATYSRLLYGTWDFGGGTLLVGQDWTPYTFWSDQIAPKYDLGGNHMPYDAENGFIGYGCLWDSRQPQVKLKLKNGFYVALIEPEKWDEDDINERATLAAIVGAGEDPTQLQNWVDYAVTDADVDMIAPKICVGYEFKTEGLMLNPGIVYNTFSVESDKADFDETINAWLVYVNGKAGLAMADLQWSVHYGQNPTDVGLWNREDAASAGLDADGDVENSTSYGGYLQVAFNVDPATITLGYGYVQSKNDEHPLGDDTDAQQSYFVNCKLPIADNFFVVPELSYYDHMDDPAGEEEADAWYAGLLWRMDF